MPILRQLEYLDAMSDPHQFRREADRVTTNQPTLGEQFEALVQHTTMPRHRLSP